MLPPACTVRCSLLAIALGIGLSLPLASCGKDGEGLFDQNWFGVLFGAAAAWQPGESKEAPFTDSYGLAFHADSTGKISQAQSELMAAHALFKSIDLGDAQDSFFWIDPFSPEGRQVAGNQYRRCRRHRPSARHGRLRTARRQGPPTGPARRQ